MILFNFPIAASKILAVIFLVVISASEVEAKKLKVESERLADKHFYRQNLINLLYDNKLEYKKIFNCSSVMFEKPNNTNGIDTACVTEDDILWISISVGSRKRPISVYVCPSNTDKNVVSKLESLAYQNDEIKNGTTHRMGLTKGWVRKFENVLFSYNDKTGLKMSCWTLNRR